MKKNQLIFLIIVTALSLSFYFNYNNSVEEFTPVQFSIIHSSNLRGETEPCGWPKNPLGGLARKASIINQEKSKGSHVLVFDTGDAFFLDDTKYNDDTRKIHAEIIWGVPIRRLNAENPYFSMKNVLMR